MVWFSFSIFILRCWKKYMRLHLNCNNIGFLLSMYSSDWLFEIIYISDSSSCKVKAISASIQNSASEKVLEGGSCEDAVREYWIEQTLGRQNHICLTCVVLMFWITFILMIISAWGVSAGVCEASCCNTGMQKLERTEKETEVKLFCAKIGISLEGGLGDWVHVRNRSCCWRFSCELRYCE